MSQINVYDGTPSMEEQFGEDGVQERFRGHEINRLAEALRDAAAHLRGAASAYREHAARHRSVGRAKPDPFFTTRAADFERAADRAVRALKA